MSEFPQAAPVDQAEVQTDPAFEALTNSLETFRSRDPELIDAVQSLREVSQDRERPYIYTRSLNGTEHNGTEHISLKTSGEKGGSGKFYDIEIGQDGRREVWVTATEYMPFADGIRTFRKSTAVLAKSGKARSISGTITGTIHYDRVILSEESPDEKKARELVLNAIYEAQTPSDGLVGVTAALVRLRRSDPELVGALKQAREAGVVTAQVYGERVTSPTDPEAKEPSGRALNLTGISSLPEPAKADYGSGVLEISVHDWASNENSERAVVTGNIVMAQNGELTPSTDLAYPTGETNIPWPGTEGNITRTLRPYRGGTLVHEERAGEGDPGRIRAMVIQAAQQIVEAGQVPAVPGGHEATTG